MSAQRQQVHGAGPARGRHARGTAGGQKGVALVVVLLLAFLSLGFGLYAALAARTEITLARNDLLGRQALNVAEAGLVLAAQLIGTHGVFNDELASNPAGGVCTGNGTGNASSGLAQLGAAALLGGACYRFHAFGPVAGGGYYAKVNDNYDDGAGIDDPLHDTDNKIVIKSVGVAGTATRTIIATVSVNSGWGFFGITKVTLSGGTTTDSFSGSYSVGTAGSSSRVGSNVKIALSGGLTKINGSAVSGGTVTTSGGASITGTTTNGAPLQTFAPVAACSPYSANAGINPSSAYNAATGQLTMGGGGTVTLDPGTYCFSTFTLSGNSKLAFSYTGPTSIYMTGKFDVSGGSVLNTSDDSSNLKIFSSSSASNNVNISGGSDAYMQVYAPATDVIVSGSSPFYGTIVGDTITASGGSFLHQQLTSGGNIALSNFHEVR